jgi:hypothetical protein
MVRAMSGFKTFWSAATTISGIEIMHMIRKGQLRSTGKLPPAQQFYSLAGSACSVFSTGYSQLQNLRQNRSQSVANRAVRDPSVMRNQGFREFRLPAFVGSVANFR